MNNDKQPYAKNVIEAIPSPSTFKKKLRSSFRSRLLDLISRIDKSMEPINKFFIRSLLNT